VKAREEAIQIGGRRVKGGIGVGVEVGVRAIRGRLGGEVPVIRRISRGPILDYFAKRRIYYIHINTKFIFYKYIYIIIQ